LLRCSNLAARRGAARRRILRVRVRPRQDGAATSPEGVAGARYFSPSSVLTLRMTVIGVIWPRLALAGSAR